MDGNEPKEMRMRVADEPLNDLAQVFNRMGEHDAKQDVDIDELKQHMDYVFAKLRANEERTKANEELIGKYSPQVMIPELDMEFKQKMRTESLVAVILGAGSLAILAITLGLNMLGLL